MMTTTLPNSIPDNLPQEDYLPTNHHDVIETVISSMAQTDSAMVQNTDQGSVWRFTYGSVAVFVQLTGEKDDDLLTVWADVLALPVNDPLALLKEVMALNWSDTLEARFALRDDHLVTLYQRTVADLSPGEISRAITLVAMIADDHDDRLKAQYPLASN
ncbi:MAG: YbjN domain-containing protein [Synechocystis sp.]|nr:YbjN domain-containing protein [Synechocystis sp.]